MSTDKEQPLGRRRSRLPAGSTGSKVDPIAAALASRRDAPPPVLTNKGAGVTLSIDETSHILPKEVPVSTLREGEQTIYVEIDRLMSNPYQPRRTMEEKALLGLMYSIKKYGLWDPLPTRISSENKMQYQLVAGHRRTEAIRRLLTEDLGSEVVESELMSDLDEGELPEDLDLSTLNVSLNVLRKAIRKLLDDDPAIQGLIGNRVPVVVRDYSDTTMMEIAWSENSRRAPLTPPEEGWLFLQRRNAGEGMTQKQLAAELGVEVTYVKRREAAARDPEDIQLVWTVGEGKGMRVVTYLRQLSSTEERIRIRDLFLSGELNTDQVRDAVAQSKAAVAAKVSSQVPPAHDSEGAREHPIQIGPPLPLAATTLTSSNVSPGVNQWKTASEPETREQAHRGGVSDGSLSAPAASVSPLPTSVDRRDDTPTTASSPLSPVSLVNSVDAEEDRERRAREAKLGTALRNLLSYHKDLIKKNGSVSVNEVKTRASIENILDDIKRSHEGKGQE